MGKAVQCHCQAGHHLDECSSRCLGKATLVLSMHVGCTCLVRKRCVTTVMTPLCCAVWCYVLPADLLARQHHPTEQHLCHQLLQVLRLKEFGDMQHCPGNKAPLLKHQDLVMNTSLMPPSSTAVCVWVEPTCTGWATCAAVTCAASDVGMLRTDHCLHRMYGMT